MPLNARSDGSTSSNQIKASWFNDIRDLLLGTTQDQAITVQNNLVLKPVGAIVAPATGCSAAAITGGAGLGIGAYTYTVSYLTSTYDGAGFGESLVSPVANVTTTTGNQHVSLTSIPTGPTGVTGRNIYRTKVGVGTQYFLATINDNTTTTYSDQATDASLSGGHLNASSNGGGVQCYGVNLQGATPNFRSSAGWFGFINGPTDNKICEMKADGSMVISGNNYGTSGGAISTTTGRTFDSFDIGEIYACDAFYDQGTVVCPGPNSLMTLCQHDNCFAASVISHHPGLSLGMEEDHKENFGQLVAMAGRVNVKTSTHIGYRILVVSDGKGGVRPVYPDEPSYTIGFTLNASQNGMVGIMLRPMYCQHI